MSNVTVENRGILYVTDQPEAGYGIQKLQSMDLGECWYANTDDDGVLLFTKHQPSLLILDFEKIGDAVHFYLALHCLCSHIRSISHQCILLCADIESESAYKLCRIGDVDDYVVVRPSFDTFHFLQAIHQAMDLSAYKRQSEKLRQNLADVGGDLRQLDDNLTETLATGSELQQEALSAFKDFTTRMSHDLAAFETHLLDSGMDNAITINDRNALQQHLKQLPHKQLEVERQHIERKLQKSESWIKTANQHCHHHVKAMCTMEFPPVRPEIMVVDDNEVYRKLIVDVLCESDFRAVGAESGQVALTQMIDRRPNVILLDSNMPVIDGIETLRRIKINSSLKTVPVIMLMEESDKYRERECVQAGAAGTIVKPANRAAIITKINENLQPHLRK